MTDRPSGGALPRWLLPVLAALFFASGAAALIYQVMWLRMLSLVFGVTAYAASTVLAGFMAGLAVGSYLAGRLAPRLRRPLVAVGAVEFLVGLLAIATPWVFARVGVMWVALQHVLPDSPALMTAARFAAAMAVLIVPTSLMGATLPLMVRAVVTQDRRLGGRIGVLYTVNTAGAIAGALVGGFYLLANVGVARSLLLAAGLNALVGIGAWMAAAAAGPTVPARDAEDGRSSDVSPLGLTRGQAQVVLWTFALSGAMSLALEVVWFRMLVVFLRPTAYAFTVMLACVLGGIALGSAAATPIIARRRPAIIGLAVLQLAAAATAVLSFNTLSRSQETAAAIAPWLHRVGVPDYVGALIAASSLAMLPTTLVLGAAFPVGLALWTSHATSSASRRVGQFYALNVAGAIVGSAGAGFVLLPWLGARGSLIVVSSVPALTSVGLALSVRRTTPNAAGFVATVGPAVFVMCALNAVDPFEVAMQRFHRTERLVWRKEGVQTTVAVHDRPAEPRTIRILYTDGVHQSNDSEGTAFIHQRIGALPVLLHPNPRSALVIGIGGGATPGAVASFGLHVDVVELAQTVVDAAAHFAHINFNLLTRPNVSIRVDDGRNYLLMTDKKYDIVTADAVFPRHAGSASLYSQEYYRLVARALAPGGLVMQWNGGSTEAEYKLLMRSFLSVFPHMTLWGDGTLMLGSLDAFTVSRQAFDARRHQAGFEGTFAWDFDTLARQYVAGPEAIRAFVGDGPVLTDDRPTIEYFLSLPSGDGNATFTGPPGNPGEIVRP